MRKAKNHSTNEDFVYKVIFILALIFLLHGVAKFTMGYHNLDLARNIMFLSQEYDFDYTDLVDTTLENKIVEIDDMYLTGAQMINFYLWQIIASSIILGYFLSKIGKNN